MIAHPAGPRHAEEIHHAGAPPRPQTARDVLALAPNVWPRNTVRDDDGVVSIAGVAVTEIADEFGTPVFVVDEDDFRSRCREIAAAFGGGEIRPIRRQGVPVHRGGALDRRRRPVAGRLQRRRTDRRAARQLPAGANRVARQQQIRRRTDRRGEVRCRARRPGLDDRDRTPRRDRRSGRRRPGRAGARHGRRRGAHPRVHLDRARRPEVRTVAGQRRGDGGGATRVRHRSPATGRPAQPYRIADLRRRRLRTCRPPCHRPAARRRRRVRRREDRADIHRGPRRRPRHFLPAAR